MIYFTAGPSQIYPTVPQHLQSAIEEGIMSISHRSSQFMDIYGAMESGLRTVLGIPADYHIFLFSSATEVWERLALNAVERESFHLINGNFSQAFASAAKFCGKTVIEHKVADFEGFDVDRIDVPGSSELIAAIGNESSTGVMMPPEDIARLRKRYPEKLIVLDAVSAVPTWRVDVSALDGLYFSVQKGFGLPAGLGVLVLSPRLLEKGLELERRGHYVGTYHRWSRLHEFSLKRQTPETPNVLSIYLLSKVCADMASRMPEILATHAAKYAAITDFVEQHPGLRFAVQDPRVRSNTVLVLDTDYPDVKAKLKEMESKGFALGTGYGKMADRQIRVANFPGTSLEQMKAMLAGL